MGKTDEFYYLVSLDVNMGKVWKTKIYVWNACKITLSVHTHINVIVGVVIAL